MRSLFELVVFFYGLLGIRLLILVLITFGAACFEIISISFFMPLLSGLESDNTITNVFRNGFDYLGIEFSIPNILIAFLILITLRSAFMVFKTSFIGAMMAKMLASLRQQLGRKIFAMNYLSFLDKSSGYLNNALVTESQNLTFSFKMLASLMVYTIFSLAYLTVPLTINPVLVVVLFAAMAVLYPALKTINAKTKSYSIAISEYSAGLQKILIQALRHFKYLKATGKHGKVMNHIDDQSEKLGLQQKRTALLQGLTEHGFEPVVAIMIAGLIYYYIVLNQGNIAEYIFLLFMVMTSMRKILGMQQNMRKLLSSWGSIGVIKKLQVELDKEKEIYPLSTPQKIDLEKSPIVLNDVWFSYGNAPPVLKEINLKIEPNTSVAIVGESGGGKSTLVNLIIGLHSPTQGSILLDITDYQSINREFLRQRIGYITQENIIFNDTIRNNITLWQPEKKEIKNENLEAALRGANLANFINSQRDGLDTLLGEGGINVSGGQRQRICIARELYKQSDLLVFDEATSSLDTKTEREIQENLDQLRGKKTIIVIAHRLSTVIHCDMIIVLKEGRICESGSYADLMRLNGEFCRMIELQDRKSQPIS